MAYWLIKSDSDTYAWRHLVADKRTEWTGVRNFAARLHLMNMAKDDRLLFYHSGTEKAIVGLAKVMRPHYPDPTATEGNWVAIEISPDRTFMKPVTLVQMKTIPGLAQMPLITIGRLSVMPVTPEEFEIIMELGEMRS